MRKLKLPISDLCVQPDAAQPGRVEVVVLFVATMLNRATGRFGEQRLKTNFCVSSLR